MSYSVSPSQLSTYALCPRKWGLGKLSGIKAAQHPSAAFGERVHRHLELWLRDCTPIPAGTPEGKVALAMVPHLPRPGRGEVEGWYSLTRPSGIVYGGKIDLLFQDDDGLWHVRDHKTTASLRYAKREDELRADDQCIQYGAIAFEKNPDATKVRLSWCYGTTKGTPKTLVRVLELTQDEVRVGLERQDKQAHHLTVLKEKSGLKGEDLPGDANACSAFGGCSYFGKNCKPGTREEEAQKMLNMMNKVKQWTQDAPAAPATETKVNPPPPPVQAAAPTAPVGGGLKSGMAGKFKAAPAAPPAIPSAPSGAVRPPAAPTTAVNNSTVGMTQSTLRDAMVNAIINGVACNGGAAAVGLLNPAELYAMADHVLAHR